MRMYEGSKFEELLAKRRTDAPQVIVAGWFLPTGEPTGAAAVVADKTPTMGELMAAWACCLAGCFKKIDELCQGSPHREQLMRLVLMMTEGLEIVDRFKSQLTSPEALAGCRPPFPEPADAGASR